MQKHRVFIGCIPGDSREEEILALLRKFAKVIHVELSTKSNSQGQDYCRGYGFATCGSRLEMERLLQRSSEIKYRNRLISIQEFKAGSQLKEDKTNFKRRRIFVGNLPSYCHTSDLRPLFLPFGDIENIYFIDQSNNSQPKFGYIIFKEVESALEAIKFKDQIFVHGTKVRVEVYLGKKQLQGVPSAPNLQAQTFSIIPHREGPRLNERMFGFVPNELENELGFQKSKDTFHSAVFGEMLGRSANWAESPDPLCLLDRRNGASLDERAPDFFQAGGGCMTRNLLYKKTKTSSFENKLPHHHAAIFSYDKMPLPSEVRSPQHLGNHPKNDSRYHRHLSFTGLPYLSDEQVKEVHYNHNPSNLRLNQAFNRPVLRWRRVRL